jgi:hypothetical protein
MIATGWHRVVRDPLGPARSTHVARLAGTPFARPRDRSRPHPIAPVPLGRHGMAAAGRSSRVRSPLAWSRAVGGRPLRRGAERCGRGSTRRCGRAPIGGPSVLPSLDRGHGTFGHYPSSGADLAARSCKTRTTGLGDGRAAYFIRATVVVRLTTKGDTSCRQAGIAARQGWLPCSRSFSHSCSSDRWCWHRQS